MITVDSATVQISTLEPHPANPRLGDVSTIADSLARYGQYRPIVVQKGTNLILAGTHTVEAAKSLGWTEIAVGFVDCDEQTARKILLADNRTSDLATYDTDALRGLLESLPDLSGTGFDVSDLAGLDTLLDEPLDLGDQDFDDDRENETPPQVGVGPYQMWVDPGFFRSWLTELSDGKSRGWVYKELRRRLDLEPSTRDLPSMREEKPSAGFTTYPIADLVPYDGNPRQGDVGAIAESLSRFGQFRPIVANRRDRTILVGNHTVYAASVLGWSEVAVSWVDVDDETARRIVAVDNRSSDRASYDDVMLRDVLLSLDEVDGTGFDLEDVQRLVEDVATGRKSTRPGAKSVAAWVADWRWRVQPHDWSAWNEKYADLIVTDTVHVWIADALGLPDDLVQFKEM